MKRNIDQNKFVEICNNAVSMADACRQLNMAYTTFIRNAKKFQCYKPYQGGVGIIKDHPKYWTTEKLKTALEQNSLSCMQTFKLKNILIKFGFKQHLCECCKLKEWNNKPIPLELHHKDGNKYNNILSNLVLLCPNCHAQTDSYRAKNKRRGAAD